MNDLFKAALPILANALLPGAGAIAGVATAWLASKLGVSEDKVQETIAGMKPEDIVKMKGMDYDFQKFCMEMGIKLDTLQIEVNKEEAKSTDKFTSRGRPAAIWVGVFGLAYQTFIEPFFRFVATVIFQYGGTFPPIDTSVTTAVLFGLLGLSGLRSYDKKNGIAA